MRKQKEKLLYLHVAFLQAGKKKIKAIKTEKSLSPSPSLPLSFLIFTEGKKLALQKNFGDVLCANPHGRILISPQLRCELFSSLEISIPCACATLPHRFFSMTDAEVSDFIAPFTSLAFSSTELQGQTSIFTYLLIIEITRRRLFPEPPSCAGGS